MQQTSPAGEGSGDLAKMLEEEIDHYIELSKPKTLCKMSMATPVEFTKMGRWTNVGPNCLELEKQLAEQFNIQNSELIHFNDSAYPGGWSWLIQKETQELEPLTKKIFHTIKIEGKEWELEFTTTDTIRLTFSNFPEKWLGKEMEVMEKIIGKKVRTSYRLKEERKNNFRTGKIIGYFEKIPEELKNQRTTVGGIKIWWPKKLIPKERVRDL